MKNQQKENLIQELNKIIDENINLINEYKKTKSKSILKKHDNNEKRIKIILEF